MTVWVKFERNKMSRGYTLLWSDDLFQSRNSSERNGIVGETRESLTWAQDFLQCWSKKKTRLNAALLDENPGIRGPVESLFDCVRAQVTCYFPVRGSSCCFLCAQAQ